uniref:Uncharacterized protein n=1 Tax=Chrysolophus pictus TaxID=9089 RepID=A0A8C3Q0L9_CHRPC
CSFLPVYSSIYPSYPQYVLPSISQFLPVCPNILSIIHPSSLQCVPVTFPLCPAASHCILPSTSQLSPVHPSYPQYIPVPRLPPTHHRSPTPPGGRCATGSAVLSAHLSVTWKGSGVARLPLRVLRLSSRDCHAHVTSQRLRKCAGEAEGAGHFVTMDLLFGRRKTPEELLRQNQRALTRAMRELDRERQKLEAQEKKIIIDIKKMAKQGQMLKLPQIQKIMMEFEKQAEIMDMKEELMNDAIDDAMGDEDDEEERWEMWGDRDVGT